MRRLLSIKDLTVRYGSVEALSKVNLRVEAGQIVSLIGANGAGKTSLLNAISGVVKRHAGEIVFDDLPLPTVAHNVVERGVVHVPEGRRVFPTLSVEDNLMAGALTRRDRAEVPGTLQHVFEVFPRLRERKSQLAGTLSGGEQQMLAIGRGLMSKPRLLMIDEPSLGLAPLLVRDVMRCIRALHNEGTTILLVEQNANKALRICDYAYVLETGRVVTEGNGADLLNDPRIREAYLGEKAQGGTEK